MTGPLRNALQKADEWLHKKPIVALSGDVLAAFVFMTPVETSKALKQKPIRAKVAAALVRGVDLKMIPKFPLT